jgi:hypothetical protein
MHFDPTLPVENTPLDAAQMRSQLNALKALADARSARVDDVDALGLVLGNTYDPADVQMIADKLDELISKLQRP